MFFTVRLKVTFEKIAFYLPRSQTSLSLRKVVGAQGWKGRGKYARRLGDFVFKRAECSMADDYAIFKKEHRPFRFTNFEGKVVFPHPVCQEEAGYSIITSLRATASLQDSPSRCPFHSEKLSKKPPLITLVPEAFF